MKLSKRKLDIAMARIGCNRSDLPKFTGLPQTTVFNVYQRLKCKPATAGKLANALGVDVTDILEDE